ncbi:hypothetical protein [Sutcliffiella deserti]|nr:hypothetical protein [Sutcliffiella deserti]
MQRIHDLLENIGEDYQEELEMYEALRNRVAARIIKRIRKGLDCLEDKL